MKLHKLSNGNWIDLQLVISIRRAERLVSYLGTYPDRIIVTSSSGRDPEVVPCDDADQAAAMMDELAGLVNDACK